MLLASASDDHSVKIWSMETRNIIQNLDGHKKEVYSLEWCPVQVYNSTDQKPRRLLATYFKLTIAHLLTMILEYGT